MFREVEKNPRKMTDANPARAGERPNARIPRSKMAKVRVAVQRKLPESAIRKECVSLAPSACEPS